MSEGDPLKPRAPDCQQACRSLSTAHGRARKIARRWGLALTAALALAACGGSGGSGSSNPFENPDLVDNTVDPNNAGKKLSFVYFQHCVNPIFKKALPITIDGAVTVNSCDGSGCHESVNGAGGAFEVVVGAGIVPVPAVPDAGALRATPMYRNYYSAQAEVVVGSTEQSRLLAKPLLLNVLHGGGLIFASQQDDNVKLIQYWITHPMPQGQDEFGDATSLFTGNVPSEANCIR